MNIISLINAIPFGNSAQKGFFMYSRAPKNFLKSMESSNFRSTISFAYERSPFYKRKFDELNINPKKVHHPEDLGDFFTTADDIREHTNDFVCQQPDTAYETTGTTSKRTKRVYFSRNEVRDAGWAGAVGLWGVGVRPEDRVVSAFDYSFWVSGPILQASCAVLGCFHVEAGRLDPEEFYDRLKDYKVTVIVGDPSWILRLSEVAEKKGPWPVKLLMGGGENFTQEAREYVEKVWDADCILSYGQTEAFGAIGMESLSKEGYLLNEFHNFFEIINPDANGYGELVYTTLNRRVMPLIRYRSGDVTRFLKGECKSGLPGRRIDKLRGRMDELTTTAIGNIAPWMFEPIFNSIESIGEDWQIVVEKEGAKDFIQFNVETNGHLVEPEVIKQEVFVKFQKEFAESWRVYQMGLLNMDVKVCPKGTLRSGRKLVRILDKRKF